MGLDCELADDSDVGRKRLNDYLKVDRRTRVPRFKVHQRCSKFIYQTKRYVWDNYRRQDERDLKQLPRDKYDDYPTLAKYLLNSGVTFRQLTAGGQVTRNLSTPFKPHQAKQKRRGDHIYRDDRP